MPPPSWTHTRISVRHVDDPSPPSGSFVRMRLPIINNALLPLPRHLLTDWRTAWKACQPVATVDIAFVNGLISFSTYKEIVARLCGATSMLHRSRDPLPTLAQIYDLLIRSWTDCMVRPWTLLSHNPPGPHQVLFLIRKGPQSLPRALTQVDVSPLLQHLSHLSMMTLPCRSLYRPGPLFDNTSRLGRGFNSWRCTWCKSILHTTARSAFNGLQLRLESSAI